MTGRIRFDVAPVRSPIDVPVSVRVLDAETGRPLTLRADLRDHFGRAWSSRVKERLARHGHPYPSEHIAYEGAGHLVSTFVPHLPATGASARHPVRRERTAFGGKAKDTAFARADSWSRIITFLDQSLKQSSGAQKGAHIELG